MKTFLFLLILSITTADLSAQYTTYSAPSAPPAVMSIHASADGIIVVATNGIVFIGSTDGSQWTRHVVPAPANHSISAVARFGGKWVVSHSASNGQGGVMTSTDGTSWVATNTGLVPFFMTFYNAPKFYDDTNRIFAFYNTNGGLQVALADMSGWENSRDGLPATVRVTAMTRAVDTLYIATNSGIYRSLDNGSNWSKDGLTSPTGTIGGMTYSNGVLFAGQQTLSNGQLFKSVDFGRTWTQSIKPSGFTSALYMSTLPDGRIAVTDAYGHSHITADAGATWSRLFYPSISQAGTQTHVVSSNGALFIGSRKDGLARGFDGVYTSTDNAATWTQINGLVGTNYPASSIAHSSGSYYVGTTNGVYSTTDFTSWNKIGDFNASISEVAFRGSTLYAGVAGLVQDLRYTTDNGTTWVPATTGIDDAQVRMMWSDGAKIYVGTPSGLYSRSSESDPWFHHTADIDRFALGMVRIGATTVLITDRGVYVSDDELNWTPRNTGLPHDALNNAWTPSDILTYNGSLVIVYANQVYFSDDLGLTWVRRDEGIPALSIDARLARKGNTLYHSYISGGTAIYASTNAGMTWTAMPEIPMPRFSATLDHNGVFHFVGQQIVTSAGASVSVERGNDADLSKSIELMANYPNPFNPRTVIGFRVGTQDLASLRLTVHDLLGREVAVLVNGVMPAGTHSVSFDASRLSSGVYLYRLESAGEVLTRKMVLLK